VVAVEGPAEAEGLRGIPIRRALSSLSSYWVVVVIRKGVFGFERVNGIAERKFPKRNGVG
jgi:hypothetical protein